MRLKKRLGGREVPAAALSVLLTLAVIVFLLSPAAAFVSGITVQIDGAASLGKASVWPLAKHDRSKPFDGFHRAVTPEVLK